MWIGYKIVVNQVFFVGESQVFDTVLGKAKQDFTAKWCIFKLIDTSIFICTIDYIEGHMEGQEQTVYTFTKEGGVGNSSLHGKYSDCIFIGWGEFEF